MTLIASYILGGAASGAVAYRLALAATSGAPEGSLRDRINQVLSGGGPRPAIAVG